MPDLNVDKQFRKNVILSYIIRGGAMFLSLITVNTYLANLGEMKYGLWLTISSIASWVMRGDLGIGNGLRNELAKAFAEGDKERQKQLINSSLSIFARLSMVLFLIITVVSEILMATGVLEVELRAPLYITNIFTCFNFILGLFWSVAHAYQLDYYASGTTLLGTFLTVVLISVATMMGITNNLVFFALACGAVNTMAGIFIMLVMKRKTGLDFGFTRSTDQSVIRPIMNIGIQFFVLQLGALILYSTDNVIINNLFGGTEVTKYSIITKVYGTGEELFSILLVSLWSAVTYQFSLKNYRWIADKIKRILLYWLGFGAGVVAVSFCFNFIVRIWLRERAMEFDMPIIFVFALYTIAGTFGSIFVNVSNGMGIIKLQMIMCVVEAVLNIPLSIFLASNCGLGIMGVKIGTLLCCTGANVVMPIYVTLLLRKRMKEQDVTSGADLTV